LLELDVGGQSDGGEVLEGVQDEVGHGHLGGDTGLEGDGGQVSHTVGEFTEEVVRGEGHDIGTEDGSVIVGGDNLHSVEEGLQVHLLEEGNLGVTDLLAGGTHLILLGDFDLSLVDLG